VQKKPQCAQTQLEKLLKAEQYNIRFTIFGEE
jgi:hypothetical protein